MMWLELEMGWPFKVVKTKDGERVVQLCNKKLERERERERERDRESFVY